MLEPVLDQVHTILTNNGIQFAEQPRNRNTISSRPMRFDMLREGETVSAIGPRTWSSGIEHRLTKPNHPWSCEDQKTVRGTVFPSNGQVERMNRTIRDATVKRFHNDDHDQFRTHLADFMAAYNFTCRLKALGGPTPYKYICKIWTSERDRFILNLINRWSEPHGLDHRPLEN